MFKLFEEQQEEEKGDRLSEDPFENSILIPRQLTKYIVAQSLGGPTDPGLQKMITSLKKKGVSD